MVDSLESLESTDCRQEPRPRHKAKNLLYFVLFPPTVILVDQQVEVVPVITSDAS